MARNARFLPRISSAICSSMVRNVQSPSLQAKLLTLADAGKAEQSGSDDEGNNDQRVEMVLSGVVGKRVWSMMQRKSYDSTAARRLSFSAEDGGKETSEADADSEMLLDEVGECAEDEEMLLNLVDYVREEFPDDEVDLLEEMLL